MDRRVQIPDLTHVSSGHHAKEFPRLANARGFEVVLSPGDTLWLPAWWWHEVTTLGPTEGEGGDGLVVSTNFWFEIRHHLLPQALPLPPSVRLELARQLEVVICDALDEPLHVLPFLRGLRAALTALSSGSGGGSVGGDSPEDATGAVAWPALEAERPHTVKVRDWEGLFEYVVFKGSMLLGAHQLLPFVVDLLDTGRFERLLRPEGERS